MIGKVSASSFGIGISVGDPVVYDGFSECVLWLIRTLGGSGAW
jgi:hypothetical protein